MQVGQAGRARWGALVAVLVLMVAAGAQAPPAAEGGGAAGPGRPGIAEMTKNFKAIDGLFSPYFNEADQRVLFAIGKQDLNAEFLAVGSIARGQVGRGGGLGELLSNNPITFRKVGKQLQVIRRAIEYKANPDTPEAASVNVTYTDDVLLALPVLVDDPERVLVDATPFFSGVLTRGLRFEPGRGSVESVKAFPENTQLRFSTRAGEDQVEVMLEFVRAPKDGSYSAREADDRIGYFCEVAEDYSIPGALSPRVRNIYRWKLEKIDPNAAVSDVKQPVVWWIEKTVPREFRSYVREGILEWNKAFERAGYRNAIEVRQQGDADNFDPNDVRYNTFRWALGDNTPYAIAVMTANPRTGQMLCGRVMFHEIMIRSTNWHYAATKGVPEAALLREGHLRGWLQEYSWLLPFLNQSGRPTENIALSDTAASESGLRGAREGAEQCQCRLQSDYLRHQYSLAADLYNLRAGLPAGSKVPVEFTGAFVKAIAMHEVGHCLGLRHNFRGSTMLTRAQLADKEGVAKTGLGASVMDYMPPNIALPGEPQGYYFTPTLGPYDYLAIEYGYKQIPANDEKGLAKIAQRTAEPGLAYATDEDARSRALDPRAALWDLGDPLDYAQHQVRLMAASLPGLAERVVPTGDGWERAYDGVMMLLSGYSRAAHTASSYLGGWYLSRDHRGDPGGAEPLVPAPWSKQRAAMRFLADTIINENTLKIDPATLRKLGSGNHSDALGDVGLALNRVSTNIQTSAVHNLVGMAVSMIEDQSNYLPGGAGEEAALTSEELMEAATGAVFRELPKGGQAKAAPLSVVRRSVERDYVKLLCDKALGRREMMRLSIFVMEMPTAADTRALARVHLRRVGAGLTALLGQRAALDAVTVAHYESLSEAIDAALKATVSLDIN